MRAERLQLQGIVGADRGTSDDHHLGHLRPEPQFSIDGMMTEDPFKEIRDLLRSAQDAYKERVSNWRSQLEQFGEAARVLAANVDEGWTQAMLDTRTGLLRLASHGWYLPSSIGIDVPPRLARDDEIDWTQIDDDMRGLWSEELSSAESELENEHPRRATILNQAFAAHRNGQYFVSVPALLSQADGICFDLLGMQLYSKLSDGRTMKLNGAVTADDRMSVAYLAPLVTVQPIAWSQATRELEPGHLNRHAVLHGEDTEYGNEINSLKAVSLLSYASWALRLARELDPTDGGE